MNNSDYIDLGELYITLIEVAMYGCIYVCVYALKGEISLYGKKLI